MNSNPHAHNHPGGQDRERLRRIAHRAMTERGLLPDYEPGVVQEVNAISAAPGPETGGAIRDQRSLPWCSIDNDDSLDLDQLSACEPLSDGRVRIFVAIADVTALIQPASAIDSHARHNTTSVYTPAEVFAMLPVKLSTNLTTLCQDHDRLAITVELIIANDGSVESSTLYPSYVHNRWVIRSG